MRLRGASFLEGAATPFGNEVLDRHPHARRYDLLSTIMLPAIIVVVLTVTVYPSRRRSGRTNNDSHWAVTGLLVVSD